MPSRASSGFRLHVLVQPDQQIKGLQPRAPLLIFYHNFAVRYTASHSNLGWSFAVATLRTLAGRYCSVLSTNHDFAAQYTAGHANAGWSPAVATRHTPSRDVAVFRQPMRAELLSQPQGLDVGGDHYGSKPKLPSSFLSTGWRGLESAVHQKERWRRRLLSIAREIANQEREPELDVDVCGNPPWTAERALITLEAVTLTVL
jgi:hypothetical protein